MRDDQACVIKLLDYLNCVLVLGLLTCFCMITNVVTEFGWICNGVAFLKTILYKRKWYIILILNLASDGLATVI